MALSTNSVDNFICEILWMLKQYRFGFEKAEVILHYLPIEDMRGIEAKGVYTLTFKIINDWLLPKYKLDRLRFYKEVGLIPVWSDPIC